jgi:hypothetical protein
MGGSEGREKISFSAEGKHLARCRRLSPVIKLQGRHQQRSVVVLKKSAAKSGVPDRDTLKRTGSAGMCQD